MYKKTQVNAQTRDGLDAWNICQPSSDVHRVQGLCAHQNITRMLPVISRHFELGNAAMGITYMVNLQRSWRTFKYPTTSMCVRATSTSNTTFPNIQAATPWRAMITVLFLVLSQFATTCKVATGKDLGTGIVVTKYNSASYSNISGLSVCVCSCVVHVTRSPPAGGIFKAYKP